MVLTCHEQIHEPFRLGRYFYLLTSPSHHEEVGLWRGEICNKFQHYWCTSMQLSALLDTLESLECTAVAKFGVDSGATPKWRHPNTPAVAYL